MNQRTIDKSQGSYSESKNLATLTWRLHQYEEAAWEAQEPLEESVKSTHTTLQIRMHWRFVRSTQPLLLTERSLESYEARLQSHNSSDGIPLSTIMMIQNRKHCAARRLELEKLIRTDGKRESAYIYMLAHGRD